IDLADLLELQYLCLLLGFRGRYNTGRAGELQAFIRQTAEKIRRIRGQSSELSPSWKPDFQAPKVAKHPWTRRLLVIALCCFGLLMTSFVLFKISLYSGAS